MMRAAAQTSRAVGFGTELQGQIVGGRFPLQEYLGGSEKTAVFLTHLPTDTKGKAAIKLMLVSGNDIDASQANWKRVAQLSHPNLAQVFGFGHCWLSGRELLYIVTEYADENLAQVFPQRTLSTQEVDAMLRPALAALAYLHDQGLVHSHFRPANVMAVNDQLKLSTDSIRAAGSVSPKPRQSEYEAPEMSTGRLSPAADVWALGVMIAESLTQHMPRDANASLIAGLPQPYQEIVRHCLATEPEARWNVRDIAAAIQCELPSPAADREPREKVHEVANASPAGSPKFASLVILLGLAATILAVVLTVQVFHRRPLSASQHQTGPVATVAEPVAKPLARSSSEISALVPIRRVLPSPSPGALRTIQGRVKVRTRLTVDNQGNVAEAHFVSPGPSRYFSGLAMAAAKQWKFAPSNGVQSQWNLLFEFTQGGVQAFPERVSPK